MCVGTDAHAGQKERSWAGGLGTAREVPLRSAAQPGSTSCRCRLAPCRGAAPGLGAASRAAGPPAAPAARRCSPCPAGSGMRSRRGCQARPPPPAGAITQGFKFWGFSHALPAASSASVRYALQAGLPCASSSACEGNDTRVRVWMCQSASCHAAGHVLQRQVRAPGGAAVRVLQRLGAISQGSRC